RLDEPVDLTLTYVPREGVAAEASQRHRDRDEPGPAASFDLETVDEEPYSGKTIDLAPALREQILLAAPPSPLCDEACKGLCPVCGKDLNPGDCGGEKTALDPRWAALKSIQLEKKEKGEGSPEEAPQPAEARPAPGALEGDRAERGRLPEVRRAGAAPPRLPQVRRVPGARSP